MVSAMNDFKDMLMAGTEEIAILDAKQCAVLARDKGTLLVDIRDVRELERDGCIAGVYHMPRGMLEFWMHPGSPYYKSVFAEKKKFIFICAKGWRARRAAVMARKLGYDASVMDGGHNAFLDLGQDAGLGLEQMDGDKFYTLADTEAILPHILKRNNIARYEDGKILIGNRKDYPFSKNFVTCKNVEDVAIAIETMVTQGVGPWVAAVHAMAMRADQLKGRADIMDELEKAKDRLVRTRPTNTLIRYRLEDVLKSAKIALDKGRDPTEFILERIKTIMDQMYKFYGRRAQYGAKLIEDADGILTMCFAETSFVLAMVMAKESGKDFTVYVPETRPFLQGARLTAPSLQECGIKVKLITDGMGAALMAEGKIQKYMTAADLITLDGHVVNKVGTLPNAVAAHSCGVPYFAFAWGCDKTKPDRASIDIENRNPADVRSVRTENLNIPTTLDDIDAAYPAFDITPPKYVAGIITRHGVLSPYTLKNGFE